MVDWELIRQRNQMEINKDNMHKNGNKVDHDYKYRYNIIFTNRTA